MKLPRLRPWRWVESEHTAIQSRLTCQRHKDTRGIDSREIPLQGLLRVRYCGAGKAEAYSERPYLRARRTTVLVRLLPRADALPVIHLRQRSELARQRVRFRRIPVTHFRGALQKTRAGGLRPRIRFFKVFRYGTA